jgi:hypothetical protein
MTTPPTTGGTKPPRKARRKVTTDLGRQLLTRERQRLSREQAALAEQQLQEAERRRTQQRRNTKSVKPVDVAISRSIVKRFAGVLASEGIQVRIIATPASTTSAWTDFEQIVINYAQQDDERILAATMRGLAYHEGGHCRFTVPFLNLAEMAGVNSPDTKLHHAWNCLEDQRMETAVTSDSPRKAAYLTTMVLADLVPSVNHAAANWPLLIWRQYLPAKVRSGARKLFVTKHNLMGVDGEALATALEAVTDTYVLATDAVTMWRAIEQYHVLLQQVAPMAAKLDDASMGHQRQYKRTERNLDDFLIIPINVPVPEAGDEADEAGDDDTVTPEQWQHLFDIIVHVLNGGDLTPPIIYANQSEGEDEGEGGSSGQQDDAPKGGSKGGSNDDDDESDEGDDEGEGDGAGSKDDDDDTDAEGNGGADDDGLEYADDEVATDTEGGSRGEHKNTGVRDDLDYKPEELTEDDLAEALAEAEAERDADPTLDADVHELHEAINNQTSDLMPYVAGVSTDAEAQAAADNLAADIEQAFQENTVEKAPGWCEGQRRGIVNVLRYETRRPGDVEFFRQWTDTEAPGTNIAVSILLDYSASMSGSVKGLAQTGYACKVACQNLDIPCTVTLWDTAATVLWDAVERAENLPVIVAVGGTDPSVAMADLDNQRYDKDIHVVIVMTDGAWSGPCATQGFLANYKGDTAGRYFIGLGYSSSDWGGGPAEAMASNLRRYGCDEAHGIDNLMDIPRYLEQALIAFS